MVQQREAGETEAAAPPSFTPGLKWMDVSLERVRVRPGKHGLRLGDLNIGTYGDVPDHWMYESLMPRGAHPPMSTLPGLGYTMFDKAVLWSDSAADLYEEGIQRRWVPALDIDWASLQPLPSEVEHAICQICTDLGEQALTKSRIVARWIKEMSYGFHEVKLMLGQEVYELAIHFEALRKRSLANGGGLGVQGTALFMKGAYDAPVYTPANIAVHLLGASFSIVEFAMLEAALPHAAEKSLCRYILQDLGRHARYGGESLRLLLHKQPDRIGEFKQYAGLMEVHMATEMRENKDLREAYIILFGHKAGSLRAGKEMFDLMRQRQVEMYLRRLRWVGLRSWETTGLNPAFRNILAPEGATA